MAIFGKTLVISTLVTALALVGCKSNSSSSVNSPLDNDEFSIDSESYATSCVVGAAAAGLTCLVFTNSDKRALCFAAAAAGCAAFMGGNYLLDQLRKDYHTREQQLDGLINTIQQNNVKAHKMANAALTQYKSDQAQLAKLERDIKQSKANKDEVQRQIALYDANIKVLQGNLESHNKQLASYKEVRASLVASGNLSTIEAQKVKECDKQIALLEADIKSISSVLENYVHDRDVLNIASSNMKEGTKV